MLDSLFFLIIINEMTFVKKKKKKTTDNDILLQCYSCSARQCSQTVSKPQNEFCMMFKDGTQ